MSKRRYQGHPAMVAARKRRERKGPPDAQERELQELTRLTRRQATLNPAEGLLVGPLAAAAEHAAPRIAERHGVGPVPAVRNYLIERTGAVYDDFDPEAFAAWLSDCQSWAISSVSDRR